MNDANNQLLIPIIDRLRSFLQDDMNVAVLDDESEIIDSEHLNLKENTVLIGTGGSVQMFLAMGFDDKLLDKLIEEFCYGEVYEGDELIEIRESVACEISNTVIGNAIKNPLDDSVINITPPILIHEAKSLAKYKDSIILVTIVNTVLGSIQLTAIGPKDVFSEKLNLKGL